MGKTSIWNRSGGLSKVLALLAAFALVLAAGFAISSASAQKAHAEDLAPASLQTMGEGTYTLSVVVNENEEYELYNQATVTVTDGNDQAVDATTSADYDGTTQKYTWTYEVAPGTYSVKIERPSLQTITDTVTVTNADVTAGPYTMEVAQSQEKTVDFTVAFQNSTSRELSQEASGTTSLGINVNQLTKSDNVAVVEADAAAMTMQWYKKVGDAEYVAIEDASAQGAAQWNSSGNKVYSYVESAAGYTYNASLAEVGTTKYKCLVTWAPDGYTAKSVESPEFTVVVSAAAPSNTHTVTFKYYVDNGTEEKTTQVQVADGYTSLEAPADFGVPNDKTFYAWRIDAGDQGWKTAGNYNLSTPVKSDVTLKALYATSTALTGKNCNIGTRSAYGYTGSVVLTKADVPVTISDGFNLVYDEDYTVTFKHEGTEVNEVKELGSYQVDVKAKDGSKFTGGKEGKVFFDVTEDGGNYFAVYTQEGINEKVLKKAYTSNDFAKLKAASGSPISALFFKAGMSVSTAFTYVTLEDLLNNAVVEWAEGSVLAYGASGKDTELTYEQSQNLWYFPDATNNADEAGRARIAAKDNKIKAPVVFALTEYSSAIGDNQTAQQCVEAYNADANATTAPRIVYGLDPDEYIAGEGNVAGKRLISNLQSITIISNQVDLATATVTVAEGSYTYNGQAFEPEVTVKLADGTVVPKANYDATYSDNVNAGTATVTVKGKLGAKGTKTANFTIAKAASTISLEDQTKAFNGKAQAYDGKVTKTGSTGAVSYKYYSDANCTKEVAAANVKNVGTYYVKATVAADANYAEATSAAVKFTISKVASSIKLAAQSKTYTGKALAYSGKVTKTGSTGKVTYKYFSDAKCTKGVKAANVKKAGTYYVKATVAADANYNAATSAAVKFTIKKAANPIKLAKTSKKVDLAKVKNAKQVVAIKKATKAQGTVTYSIAKVNKSKKNFSINKKTGKITVKKGTKAGTYKVTVKALAKGNANYKSGYKTAVETITVG